MFAALAVAGTEATAKERKPKAPPAQMEALIACRSETNDAARLQCYDRAATALTEATANGSVVMIDREDVKRTRRSLFGFSVPDLPFFDGDDSQDEEQAKEIEAVIQSARPVGFNKWMIVLEDGAVWQTTEASSRMADPRAGQKVRIKRAALGSYLLSVNDGRAVRAMRTQ
jgi:hypothetical protein